MKITCPNCSTRYDVDDRRFEPNGRSVRCAECGESWFVHAPEPIEDLTRLTPKRQHASASGWRDDSTEVIEDTLFDPPASLRDQNRHRTSHDDQRDNDGLRGENRRRTRFRIAEDDDGNAEAESGFTGHSTPERSQRGDSRAARSRPSSDEDDATIDLLPRRDERGRFVKGRSAAGERANRKRAESEDSLRGTDESQLFAIPPGSRVYDDDDSSDTGPSRRKSRSASGAAGGLKRDGGDAPGRRAASRSEPSRDEDRREGDPARNRSSSRTAAVVDADFEDVDNDERQERGFGRKLREERHRATALMRLDDLEPVAERVFNEEFFTALRVQPRELERAIRKARRRAEAREKNRMTPLRALGWSAWLGVVAATVFVVYTYREQIVALFPNTANAYRVVGLEANPFGLKIENVSHRLAMSTVGQTIEIKGRLRNETAVQVTPPILQAEALGPRGELLARWTFEASGSAVKAGETVDFSTRAPAPDGVKEISLSFAPAEGVKLLVSDPQ